MIPVEIKFESIITLIQNDKYIHYNIYPIVPIFFFLEK